MFRQTLPRIRTEYLPATSERGSQVTALPRTALGSYGLRREFEDQMPVERRPRPFCNSARSSRRASPVGLGDLLPVSVYSSRDGVIA
jgi:hypothetical protein